MTGFADDYYMVQVDDLDLNSGDYADIFIRYCDPNNAYRARLYSDDYDDDDLDDAGTDQVVVDEGFGSADVTFTHCKAGNLVDDGRLVYTYDAWNRLVEVSQADETDVTIHTARYDGLGRRVRKVVTNAGVQDGTTVFYYEGQKIIETRDGSGNMVMQAIHGVRYIDELVMLRFADKGDLYVHQGERSEREQAAIGKASRIARVRPATRPERASTTRATGGANFNVIALTDLAGRVVEQYSYKPYGEVTVDQSRAFGDVNGDGDTNPLDRSYLIVNCLGSGPTGDCRDGDLDFDDDVDATDYNTLLPGLYGTGGRHPALASSSVGNPFLHQGLYYDAELESYQNRARQYDPKLKRFMQRDPLGYADGLQLYSYLSGNPAVLKDPLGTLPVIDGPATITDLCTFMALHASGHLGSTTCVGCGWENSVGSCSSQSVFDPGCPDCEGVESYVEAAGTPVGKIIMSWAVFEVTPTCFLYPGASEEWLWRLAAQAKHCVDEHELIHLRTIQQTYVPLSAVAYGGGCSEQEACQRAANEALRVLNLKETRKLEWAASIHVPLDDQEGADIWSCIMEWMRKNLPN